jgi:hypothetical protein
LHAVAEHGVCRGGASAPHDARAVRATHHEDVMKHHEDVMKHLYMRAHYKEDAMHGGSCARPEQA